MRGDTEAVRVLLEKGANIEAKDRSQETALQVAALNGRTTVVKLLLEKGANTGAKDRFVETPLHVAAQWGQVEVARQLLDGGANIEARDDQGETPLHVAARRASIEVLKLLLDRGAQIEARDNNDFTPLICAAEAGGIVHLGRNSYVEKYPAVDAVNLLLDRGANIEAKSNWGQTALHRTVFHRRPDVVKALLDRGANIQAMDNHSETPLFLANQIRRGFERVMEQHEGNSSPSYQPSADRLVSDNAEVIRVLEEALAKHPPSTFADYVSDLQNHPLDRARRDHVVKLAAALPTLPPIPEQARRLYEQASTLMRQARGPQELEQPMSFLRWALVFAPWWGDAYYQLSRALELTGRYDLAMKNLSYYIELNPPEAEARAARNHLIELQTKMGAATGKQQ
jgi:tetratricopeptide (TPR) repeat protein